MFNLLLTGFTGNAGSDGVENYLKNGQSFDFNKTMDSMSKNANFVFHPDQNTLNFFNSLSNKLTLFCIVLVIVGLMLVAFTATTNHSGLTKSGYILIVTPPIGLFLARFGFLSLISYKIVAGKWFIYLLVIFGEITLLAMPLILFVSANEKFNLYLITDQTSYKDSAMKIYRNMILVMIAAIIFFVLALSYK